MSPDDKEQWVVLSGAASGKALSPVSVFGTFDSKQEAEEWIKTRDTRFSYMPKLILK